MALVITDRNGREHHIDVDDPAVMDAFAELKRWMDELAEENTRLVIRCLDLELQNSRGKINLRRTEAEVAQIQQVIDTSISGLDL